MNNSLEHLERGYFDCFHEMVKATREVLADINEIDATYIRHGPYGDGKMAEGHNSGTITDMHTDDCVVCGMPNCNAIDEATQKFR